MISGQRALEVAPVRLLHAGVARGQEVDCSAAAVWDSIGRSDVVIVSRPQSGDRTPIRKGMAGRDKNGATVGEDEVNDLMAGRNRH